MTTFNFTTKQKGYGRKGLYFDFDGKSFYLTDVFPNVTEQFEDFELTENCFFNEEDEKYYDQNGHEVTPIDSWDSFLTDHYKEEIGQILYENLDSDDYEFNFDSATYEDITNWALEY